MPALRSRTSTYGRNMAGRALWCATGMTDSDLGKPIVADSIARADRGRTRVQHHRDRLELSTPHLGRVRDLPRLGPHPPQWRRLRTRIPPHPAGPHRGDRRHPATTTPDLRPEGSPLTLVTRYPIYHTAIGEQPASIIATLTVSVRNGLFRCLAREAESARPSTTPVEQHPGRGLRSLSLSEGEPSLAIEGEQAFGLDER